MVFSNIILTKVHWYDSTNQKEIIVFEKGFISPWYTKISRQRQVKGLEEVLYPTTGQF